MFKIYIIIYTSEYYKLNIVFAPFFSSSFSTLLAGRESGHDREQSHKRVPKTGHGGENSVEK